jgi:hypothetical protein
MQTLLVTPRLSADRADVGARHPNPRSYSVEEVSRLFAIHKNTVRNWLRQGLTAIDQERPTVIQGLELRRFLSDRRARQKQTCGAGRIFCLPCRAPKVPAGNMAECIPMGATTGTLRGICPDCDRMIYRRVNPQKLDAVRGDLDITVAQARARIEETVRHHVNCDSAGGGHR